MKNDAAIVIDTVYPKYLEAYGLLDYGGIRIISPATVRVS